jgi:hypothetical protein
VGYHQRLCEDWRKKCAEAEGEVKELKEKLQARWAGAVERVDVEEAEIEMEQKEQRWRVEQKLLLAELQAADDVLAPSNHMMKPTRHYAPRLELLCMQLIAECNVPTGRVQRAIVLVSKFHGIQVLPPLPPLLLADVVCILVAYI